VGVAGIVDETDDAVNVELRLASSLEVRLKIVELFLKGKMLGADEDTVLLGIADTISDVELTTVTKLDAEVAGDINGTVVVTKISDESVMLSRLGVGTISDDEFTTDTTLETEIAEDVNVVGLAECILDNEAVVFSELEGEK
jgi:hypothetical protein